MTAANLVGRILNSYLDGFRGWTAAQRDLVALAARLVTRHLRTLEIMSRPKLRGRGNVGDDLRVSGTTPPEAFREPTVSWLAFPNRYSVSTARGEALQREWQGATTAWLLQTRSNDERRAYFAWATEVPLD